MNTKRTKKHLWMIFTSMLSSIAVLAQGDIPYLTEQHSIDQMLDTLKEDVIDLEAVTITFDAKIDQRSHPSISTISTDLKNQFNSQAIPQILNTVPGVFMHSGAYNTNRITIRGIGSRNLFGTAKIKAYFNDIPLTNGIGETSLEDIDLSLINNISIVKGPTASEYGAGLGGMIHLNTSNRRRLAQSELFGEVRFGAFGLSSQVLGAKLDLGIDNQIVISGNSTQSDGYRNNNEYTRSGFAAFGDHRLSSKVKVSWIANYIDLRAQIPSSLNFDDFTSDPKKAAFTWGRIMGFEDYKRWLLGASIAYQISDRSLFKASIFGNAFDSYESRPFNILEENNGASGIRATYTQSIDTNIDFKIGLEGFSEQYNWQTYVTNDGDQGGLLSDNEEDRKYLNVFLKSNIDLSDRLHLEAGVNLNTTNYDYSDLFDDGNDLSGDYTFDPIWSPNVRLSWDISKSKRGNQILYGLINHGFSPPSLEETLLPDGQINPDIQPERGLNLEVGIKGASSDFSYQFNLYSMTVRDLLVARRTAADQFIGINAGKTLHNGFEAQTMNRFNLGSIQFEWTNDLALQDYTFKEFIDGGNDYSGNTLTGTPATLWRSQLTGGINGLKIGVGYYTVGQQELRDDNSIQYEGYGIAHAFASYDLDISDSWSFKLLARVDNLFDKDYASMLLINAGSFGGNAPRYYYPGLPRNAFFSARINYKF